MRSFDPLGSTHTLVSVMVVVAESNPLFPSWPFSSSQARRSAINVFLSASWPLLSMARRRMRGRLAAVVLDVWRAAAVTSVGVIVAFLSVVVARSGTMQALVMAIVLTTGTAVNAFLGILNVFVSLCVTSVGVTVVVGSRVYSADVTVEEIVTLIVEVVVVVTLTMGVTACSR